MAEDKKMVELGVKGLFINTAIMFGILASENHFAYGASKAAIESMTKTAALEFAPICLFLSIRRIECNKRCYS
jgi:NAD(P)-dependent dehydrogenase (short-subunit alcohol dehydrogenase family)